MRFHNREILQILLSVVAIAVRPLASAALEDEFPSFRTTTLSKVEFQVPADLPDQPVALVIGFTKDSQNQCAEWSDHLRKTSEETGISVYDIPVIEDAPGFVRGLIMRSMRKQTPKPYHSTFLMLVEGSAPLKTWIGYDDSDDAFLVLLDGEHQPIWFTQGIHDESKWATFTQALRQLGVNTPSVM